MARILGANRVRQKLKALQVKARKSSSVSVVVGYTANYAVYVHENKEARHPNGQSKFLEQPFREKAGEIAGVARKWTKVTGSLLEGLYMAGMFLQRVSQALVPVDTGNLHAGAFTEKE